MIPIKSLKTQAPIKCGRKTGDSFNMNPNEESHLIEFFPPFLIRLECKKSGHAVWTSVFNAPYWDVDEQSDAMFKGEIRGETKNQSSKANTKGSKTKNPSESQDGSKEAAQKAAASL